MSIPLDLLIPTWDRFPRGIVVGEDDKRPGRLSRCDDPRDRMDRRDAQLVIRVLIHTTIIDANAYPRSATVESLQISPSSRAAQTQSHKDRAACSNSGHPTSPLNSAEDLGFKLQDASDLNADRTNSTMRRSGLGYEGKGWQGSVGRRRRMEEGTGEAGPHWYVVPDSLVVYAHISTPSADIVSDREILRGVSGCLPQTKNFAVLGVVLGSRVRRDKRPRYVVVGECALARRSEARNGAGIASER
ncbi:hypothetical protein DFP72DRAFT_1170677 [Ephemerocybe angulata]|uniref:Uncharacterized protein n=1 Tax=Ephemerocybe angulata TaxID=980116 RepID=A0A8H6HVE3_9AGAR|nr:hypothetical protein DFP72DRAFT_1170677 [Tulosesus angulatus]